MTGSDLRELATFGRLRLWFPQIKRPEIVSPEKSFGDTLSLVLKNNV